ncbi:MAG: TolC family protein [Spirochaetales bacterium]|nr:TolC family protein [Spirochaetales bacterium]
MKRFLLLFLGGLLGSALWAQAPEGLTLDQAVKEALEHNLSLQAAGVETSIKKRDHDLAWNKFYPSISVSGGYLHLNQVIQPLYIPPAGLVLYSSPYLDNITTDFSAQIAITPALFAQVDQTLIDYDNAKVSLAEARQNLTTEVKKLFYQLLVLQETIKVTKADLANADERYRQAQVNYKAGLAPELTMLQAEVAYENRKPALDNLNVNYDKALFAFENLLGRESDPTLKISGNLNVSDQPALPDAKVLIQKFIDQRLDIEAAKGQIRSAQGHLNTADLALWPTLIVHYSADPTLNSYYNLQNGWSNSSNWIQQTGSFSVMLNWKLDSLIPTSQSDNQRQDASDQIRAADLQLAQLEQTARSQVMTLVARLNTSAAALASQEKNVDVALKAYQLTNDAYRTGARSFLEVQDAELQYETAQLNLLSEKERYISSLLDLETALNTTRKEIYGQH